MSLALFVALASVAAGAALVLLGSRSARFLSPIRSFALISAVGVVLLQLLPAALAEIGITALAVFALALVLPAGFERLAGHARGVSDASWVAVELGYAGLFVHQLADGLTLGLHGGLGDGSPLEPRVLIAIGAHTIPVTAVFVLAFAERYGMRSALVRAAGLALASGLGVALVDAAPARQLTALGPWVLALSSGLLLHVIGHDWHAEAPGSMRARWLDFGAIIAGIGVALLGGEGGHVDIQGDSARLPAATLQALRDVALETAPLLLIGLAGSALLQTASERFSRDRARAAGSAMLQATRGALEGARRPILACSVIPLARLQSERGRSPARVVGFVLATPALGLESLLLSAHFLGWPFAAARLAGAVGAAIAGALLLQRMRGPADGEPAERGSPVRAASASQSLRRAWIHFAELLHHVGPFSLVGLIVAAYLQVGLPADALSDLRSDGLDILLVALIAAPSHICAAGAMPIAAVLIAKGVSPGAVLAGLLLGPASNVAVASFLRHTYGGRAALAGLVGLALAVVCFAIAGNLLALETTLPHELDAASGSHAWWSTLAATLLVGLVLFSVWRRGVRSWLGSLGEAFGWEDHEHTHSHAHPGPPTQRH